MLRPDRPSASGKVATPLNALLYACHPRLKNGQIRFHKTICSRFSMLSDEAIARLARATTRQTNVENETRSMPLTPEQRSQINKANSLKSTGPSAAGKLRSRCNALKHGLRAKVLALPNEDPAVVEARAEAWNEHYQPQSPGKRSIWSTSASTRRCSSPIAASGFHGRTARQADPRSNLFDRTNSRVDDLHRLDALLTKDPGRAVGELRRTAPRLPLAHRSLAATRRRPGKRPRVGEERALRRHLPERPAAPGLGSRSRRPSPHALHDVDDSRVPRG